MKLKLLTIPFNPQTRRFEDKLFESFQEDKEIRQFHPLKQKNRPSVQKRTLETF